MDRRSFIIKAGCCTAGFIMPRWVDVFADAGAGFRSPLGKLTPVGRVMETEGYYVWCSCPIDGPDGKVHLFYSRWDASKKMSGWINGSEIAHAVADSAEGPFVHKEVVLAPRKGYFDATTCHNPFITFVDGKYCLFYMGNNNGKTNTKRIGLAMSDSLDGPWTRIDSPLIEPGPYGAWDDHCTTNPAFIKRNNRYWLYYKSWNTEEAEQATGPIKGNRKYGLAVADKLEGPYRKYEGNPVIDFSVKGNNKQFEDAFIWQQNNRLNIIARDMGVYNHECGLLMHSRKGYHWSEPEIAYNALSTYIEMPPPPPYLKKYGRLERPMLLIRDGKPAYLFGAAQGGAFQTSSTFIFKIT